MSEIEKLQAIIKKLELENQQLRNENRKLKAEQAKKDASKEKRKARRDRKRKKRAQNIKRPQDFVQVKGRKPRKLKKAEKKKEKQKKPKKIIGGGPSGLLGPSYPIRKWVNTRPAEFFDFTALQTYPEYVRLLESWVVKFYEGSEPEDIVQLKQMFYQIQQNKMGVTYDIPSTRAKQFPIAAVWRKIIQDLIDNVTPAIVEAVSKNYLGVVNQVLSDFGVKYNNYFYNRTNYIILREEMSQ